MSALEMRAVWKLYGAGATEVHALRNVDLTVEPGSLVAVMGPSGSGKSTLTHVPVLDLAILLGGLPVVAFVAGWLLAGREPSAIVHRPLE